MLRLLPALAAALWLAGPARCQDTESGPGKVAKVPALRVHDATGAHKGKQVDYPARREGRPTLYLLLWADQFDRPMNRFLKGLDKAVAKDFPGTYAVAVWLTDDVDKTKALLPRVQESVQYEATALTYHKGKEGPKGWNVNADARLTVVLADKGKVVRTWGYKSVNETDVAAVTRELKKARGGK
jgi:hypothetical protein